VTLYDLIAILTLLVSGVIGFVRGATREVVTVVAFIVAVALAVLSLRVSGGLARHAIHPPVLANAVAVLVVFTIVYVLLKLAGARLTQRVRTTEALSVLDRAIGVGFGLVRALVLLGVFYLVFNAATPPERVPHWIKDAALYPLSGASGHVLMAMAHQGSAVANTAGPVLEKAVKEGVSDRAKAPPSAQGRGYGENSRKQMDELVEKTR